MDCLMKFTLQVVCDGLTARRWLFPHKHAVNDPIASRKTQEEAAEPFRALAGVDEQPVHSTEAHDRLCHLDGILIEKPR